MLEKKNLEMDILVTHKDNLSDIKIGFTPINKDGVLELEKRGEYKTRYKMEEDLNYRQFLPYTAIERNNEIFLYQRSNKGGEPRVFNQYSLGIGGHVDTPETIYEAIIKELEEEVGIKIEERDLKTVGLLKLNDGVEEFHLGIAMILHVDDTFKTDVGELDKLVNRRFIPVEELKNRTFTMERWSELFYEEYLKNIL